MSRIVVIDGHPDPDPARFVHALADAYAKGAKGAGHEVTRIDVAKLDFPVLRSRQDWMESAPPADIAKAQEAIRQAEHLVILYPLWLGDIPALLKAFFEQTLRPGFAIAEGRTPKPLLSGRSARVIVTMGMPAFWYRIVYRSHSLKSLERAILKLCGIKPVHATVIGMVEGDVEDRKKWLEQVAQLGREETA